MAMTGNAAAHPIDSPRALGGIAAGLLGVVLLVRPFLRPAASARSEMLLLWCVLGAGVVVAWGDAQVGETPRLPRAVAKPLAVFWACAALSWARSIHQMHSSETLLALMVWTIVFLCATRFAHGPRWRPTMEGGLMVVSGLVAVLALLQRARLFDVLRALPAAAALDPERLASNRVYGTFLSPGVYGSFLALMVPWHVGLAEGAAHGNRGRGIRVLGWAVVVAGVVALWLTRSRAAWLATAVSLAAYAGLTRGRRAFGVALVMLGAAGASALGLVPGLAAGDTLAARLTYWRGTLGMMRLRPLTGTGLGTWGDAYPTVFAAGGFPSQAAHNDWLQRGAETGVVGGVAFALFVLAVLRLGVRPMRDAPSPAARRRAAGLWCGALGVCVAAVFDYPFTQPSVAWMVAVVFGLLVADGCATAFPRPTVRRTHLHAVGLSVLLMGAAVLGYRHARGAAAWQRATEAAAAQDSAGVDAACAAAMRWTPGAPEPYGLLAAMHVYAGLRGTTPAESFAVAAVASAAAVVRAPWDPWLADRAGVAHWQWAAATGDATARTRAVGYFRSAAAHFPAHPEFQLRLANVLTDMDAPDAAAARARVIAARVAWRDTPGIGGPSTPGPTLKMR